MFVLDFKIEIQPLKWLYYNLENDDRNVCAIIASSYDVRVDKLTKLKSKLILSFNDIIDSNNASSFNKSIAGEIHFYINSLQSDVEVLYVCCDSGESRSSAIAAAITRFYGKDDMEIWSNPHYHPNPLVYKLLCEEFGVVLFDGELEDKINLNNNALTIEIANARKKQADKSIIDIHSKGEYPSCALSNFADHEFYIDNVKCSSMEGFLQSLKFKSIKKQKQICLLSGKEAKESTRHTIAQFRWRITHNLYWQGERINRFSDEYQKLIDRAYEALSKNPGFQKALRDASSYNLTHSIGKTDVRKTVLTEYEFISRLERLRKNYERRT